MNIQIKANIALTQQDLEQAIRDYVTANGFDLTDKEVEFSELPDGVDILVATDSLPEAADAKPTPAKRRSPQKKAEPKPETEAPVDVEPEPDTTEPDEPVVEDTPVKLSREALSEAISAKERAFLQPEAVANPFATEAATTEVDEPVEPEPEAIFGQEALDQDVVEQATPAVNTKSLFDTPAVEDTAPVKVSAAVSAKSIFG